MFPQHSSSLHSPTPPSPRSASGTGTGTGLQLESLSTDTSPAFKFQDPTPRIEKPDPLHQAEAEGEGEGQGRDGELASPTPRRASGVPPLSPSRNTNSNNNNMEGLSLTVPRQSKGQAGGSSPSRIPHLNALSPLQSFSPLQASPGPRTASTITESAPASVPSEGRGRLVRSMSRKQSMYASAAQWEKGQYERDHENRQAGGLFSRITLVKAPDVESGLKKRSKSSSALAPFTAMSNSFSGNPTSDRGPRRSFAAASFGNSRPMHVRTPSGSGLGINTAHRLGDGKTNAMTPEAIFDLANSLKSPVAMPEGGFKGAELKRRKSAGSSVSRRSSHSFALTETSPGDPPIALEPVEYVQLEDDVLLPFVDRPEEVAELIEHPNNETLFTMLKTTFPKGAARDHWQALSPEEWNWKEFNKHLALTRIECPDYQWIFRARQACRRRSVAMWEKLGVCFGCDGDLLNAGGEDGLPSTWGVNAPDEDEDDYGCGSAHAWIQGLEAVDPDEAERAERDFAGAFGEIVDEQDEERVAGLGMGMGSMGAIGEDEEEIKDVPAYQQTPAQRAGNRSAIDPFHSPSGHNIALGHAAASPRSVRSKSFVGLTIQTSPPMGYSPSFPSTGRKGSVSFVRSPSALSPVISSSGNSTATQTPAPYQTDRGPDAPLFPGSFKNLSVVPNLGRVAGVGGTPGVPGGKGAGVNNPLAAGQGGKWKLNRKQSGAGLSESAITFTSESDYGPIHDENVAYR